MIDIGTVVNGKYRLVRILGDGGMGSVYEAQHAMLGTRVAVKVLHPELGRKSGLVERFLQEARVSAQIRSPHVVQVTDVDRTPDGHAYIVMELLEGEPLSNVLDRQRRLPVATACEYTVQILEALEAAHALGVVHRDLKPENVFVTFAGGRPVLKLIDFGIAKARRVDPRQKNLTVAGVVMGTAEYMAPEQARSADTVDPRADLYAVGVMLYEMMAGTRPVRGDSGIDARVIALKVERGEVTPLLQAMPDAPRDVAGHVHRAMAPRPELRFATATEMRLAIEAAMNGRRPSAVSTGSGSRAPSLGQVSTAPMPATPNQQRSTAASPVITGPPEHEPHVDTVRAPPIATAMGTPYAAAGMLGAPAMSGVMPGPPHEPRKRVPVAAIVGLSVLLLASVGGILVGTGAIALSSSPPAPPTSAPPPPAPIALADPAATTAGGSTPGATPAGGATPPLLPAIGAAPARTAAPPAPRPATAPSAKPADEPDAAPPAAATPFGLPTAIPNPERVHAPRRLSLEPAERLPELPGLARAPAGAHRERGGIRRARGLLKPGPVRSPLIEPLHQLADAWGAALRPARLRVELAGVSLVWVAALLLARQGTTNARAGAAALALASVVAAAVWEWRARRRTREPAHVLRGIGRRVDPPRVDRALRALAFVGPGGEVRVEGTSLELARLHLSRVLADLPREPILGHGARIARRANFVALGLAACAIGLTGVRAWSVLEGGDVLFARAGLAPVAMNWLDGVELTARPPEYLHESEIREIAFTPLALPFGTSIAVRGEPLHAGRQLFLSDGTTEVPFVEDGAGAVVARWTLGPSSTLKVLARFGDVAIEQADGLVVTSIPDEAPVVKLEGAPRRVRLVDETDDIPIKYEAADDHGLREVHLVLRCGGREERRVLARLDGEARTDAGGQILKLRDGFLRKSHAPVEVTVEAKDNDPLSGPKWGASEAITIIPPDVGEPEALRLDALRKIRDALVDSLSWRLDHEVPSGAADRKAFVTDEKKRTEDDERVIDEALSGTYAGVRVPGRTRAMVLAQRAAVRKAVDAELRGPSGTTHGGVVKATEHAALVADAIVRGLGVRDTRDSARQLADVADNLAAGADGMSNANAEARVRNVERMDVATMVLAAGGRVMMRLGALGHDLGEIVDADLPRVKRGRDASDFGHATLAARDLATRLRQPESFVRLARERRARGGRVGRRARDLRRRGAARRRRAGLRRGRQRPRTAVDGPRRRDRQDGAGPRRRHQRRRDEPDARGGQAPRAVHPRRGSVVARGGHGQRLVDEQGRGRPRARGADGAVPRAGAARGGLAERAQLARGARRGQAPAPRERAARRSDGRRAEARRRRAAQARGRVAVDRRRAPGAPQARGQSRARAAPGRRRGGGPAGGPGPRARAEGP